jgi:D-alanyl-lipoteichoic acid acyltransferase DltB (MBOAT superfamily)
MGLMVLLSYLNFKLALRLVPEDRATLILPVAINVCVLIFFRILVLFLNQQTVFPTGLSFYVLSAISYLTDVYEDRIDPEEKFQNLLLYLMMFPKLFLGPLVRYEQISDQLTQRRHHPRGVFEGFQRFAVGLGKVVLLADFCGRILAEVNASGADTTLIGVWFAAILFLFQIYYAFSGYCDMAIGLGGIFGFHFCENFKYPYLASSFSEFWQHWNMSVSRFFRDYVYFPLGGKQLGKNRQFLNLFFVWLLTGLWYGIGYNYLLWSVYVFVVLMLEKHFMGTLDNISDGICRCITLFLVLIGWVIFSNSNLSDLQNAFLAMLGYGGFATEGLGQQIFRSLPLLLVCTLGCTRFPASVGRVFTGICGMSRRQNRSNGVTALRVLCVTVSAVVTGTLIWLCTVSLAVNGIFPGFPGNF